MPAEAAARGRHGRQRRRLRAALVRARLRLFAVDELAVQFVARRGTRSSRTLLDERHEAKTSRTLGGPVDHDHGIGNRSKPLKMRAEVRIAE